MNKNVFDVVQKQLELYSKRYLAHELVLFSWIANFIILIGLGYLYNNYEIVLIKMTIIFIVTLIVLLYVYKKISGKFAQKIFRETNKVRTEEYDMKRFSINSLDNTYMTAHIIYHLTYYGFVYLGISKEEVEGMPFLAVAIPLCLIIFFTILYRLYQIYYLKTILLYLGSEVHIEQEEEYYNRLESENEKKDYIKQASASLVGEICPRLDIYNPVHRKVWTALKKFKQD